MSAASPAVGELTRTLATLLDLERRARDAASEAELGFLLVNETVQLLGYRQAALWFDDGGVRALSGLVQPELNAPYAQWLSGLFKTLARSAAEPVQVLTAETAPPDLAGAWAQWWPAHAVWIAIPPDSREQNPRNRRVPAALVLAREQAFAPAELELLREWVGAWAHALIALRARRRRRLFGFGYRDTEGALPVRRSRWFRPGWFALLVLVAVAAIPVRHSVLAPGELVPSRPQIVRAPLDGVIDSFLVEPNQEVKKGQPLFRFDEALIQSRLEVAQQALATASAEYRQTMQQAVTDQRVRVQLSALAGRIEERRTEVAYLTDQLARARVLAPQDGIALFDDPLEWIGKPVTIGERILRVAAANEVEIEAWLPIADAIPLPAGAPVQLFLNAQPLQPVSATLRFMAHEAVQRADGSFAYRVRATLDHETEHRVGLKGTARLQGATVPLVYWVLRRPIAALRTTIGF
jgi:hypothetical protein